MFVPLCSFFFDDPATAEIYTLSLHDALPICRRAGHGLRIALRALEDLRTARRDRDHHLRLHRDRRTAVAGRCPAWPCALQDRKSTRLNSSLQIISYAVFCLKKKTPDGEVRRS